MEKEFIVTFPSSIQITEDSYKTVNPTLKVGSNTTVGEIETFYRKWNKSGRMEVKITELSQLEDY